MHTIQIILNFIFNSIELPAFYDVTLEYLKIFRQFTLPLADIQGSWNHLNH